MKFVSKIVNLQDYEAANARVMSYLFQHAINDNLFWKRSGTVALPVTIALYIQYKSDNVCCVDVIGKLCVVTINN